MKEIMDTSVYSQMQLGQPYKSYKKTILGQVYCSVINPFSNEVEGIILSGDPRKNQHTAIIDMWNEMQDVYFRRANKRHLETGTIISFVKPADMEDFNPEPFADASDEDIVTVLNSKYLKFLSSINKCTTEVVLFRFLNKARELEKSEKMIKVIQAKLSELQSGETEK